MQLVTDNAADISPEQIQGLTVDIHRVPLTLTLDGKSYLSGIDIHPDEFYDLMGNSEGMPTTSQPAPGDFAKTYQEVAEKTGDKEILSIHISSGLSGTWNAARLGAQQVEADGIKVHIIDSLTLSAPEGWQVEAAARAIAAGWDLDQIKTLLKKISDNSDAMFTLPTLKYLIHGGRISHLTGLVASTLGIKPIIGVDKEGKYDTRARVRTFKKAVRAIADQIGEMNPSGGKLRVQPLHALGDEGVDILKDAISKKFDVEYMPTVPIAPILGAHTGSGLVGCAWACVDNLPDLP